MGQILSYKHGKGSVEGVDPRLWEIVQHAVAASPYDAEIRSGAEQRRTNASNHNRGWAVDVTLIDPATGEKIPDYQHGPSFAIYEQFAQTARVYQQQAYPELDKVFRWGGYFSKNGNPFGYGAADLMHLDITPGAKGAMALGSWERGAKKALLDYYPGAVSNGGLGGLEGARRVAQYRSALEGSGGLVPPGALNDEAPTPADRSGLEDLRRRWAENAPVPMPRPASRMPAPAASWGSGIAPADRMTAEQVAGLYDIGPMPLQQDGKLVQAGANKLGVPGMVEPGNINLTRRPQVVNADGSISTIRAASFNIDGREVLIPTISPDGKVLSESEAVRLYRETGQHLGKFTSPQAASDYSKTLSERMRGNASMVQARPGRLSDEFAPPRVPLPLDPRLDRAPGSLPAGRPSLPLPNDPRLALSQGALPPRALPPAIPGDPRLSLPAGGLPAARPRPSFGIVDSAPSPRYWSTAFGDEGVVVPPIATSSPAELRDYGADNRMGIGGLGSLLDPRTSPLLSRPRPSSLTSGDGTSFANSFANRLASGPPPGSAASSARPALPAPRTGMLSDENATPSFTGSFANRVRSVPGAPTSSPAGAGAPVSVAPFTRPTLTPQQPTGSGQPISLTPFLPPTPVGSGAPISLTPFSRPPATVPRTQFGGEGMPSTSAGGGRPVEIDPDLLRRLDTLPDKWTGLPWAGSATGVPAPPPLPRPRPTLPAVPSVPQWITTTKMVPNPAYKPAVAAVPLAQTIRVENGVPVGLAPINPNLQPRAPAVPKMIPQTIRVLNPDYVAPVPAFDYGMGTVQRQEQSRPRRSAISPALAFLGTATRSPYNVGQTYAAGGRVYQAQPNGTFRQVSTVPNWRPQLSSAMSQSERNPIGVLVGAGGGGSSSSGGNPALGGTTRSMEKSTRWITGY